MKEIFWCGIFNVYRVWMCVGSCTQKKYKIEEKKRESPLLEKKRHLSLASSRNIKKNWLRDEEGKKKFI